MKKIILFSSKLVLVLVFLNIFAWTIWHVNNGGKRLGVLTSPLQKFSTFPVLVRTVFNEITKPERLLISDSNFIPINKLDYDLYALNATYNASEWIIDLVNLRSDSTKISWKLNEENYNNTGRVFSHSEPLMPIMLDDRSLIINNHESNNLFRLNENSEIIWHNTEHQFHHSINLDAQGEIWACTRALINSSAQNIEYWDNHLTKIDARNGQVLYHKSLSEILLENNLSYILHGYSNSVFTDGNDDPFHLNEIEPVLEDGTHWNQGDLFLSLRHRSMILLYRPSTNKIINIIQGPFFNQHDIDIRSDSTITLFNNNVTSLSEINQSRDNASSEGSLEDNTSLNVHAEVLEYNFRDSSFTSLYQDQFAENEVYAKTQGIHHVLSTGDIFVDNNNSGKVYIFGKGGTILKKYYNQSTSSRIENTHWVRIYENINF